MIRRGPRGKRAAPPLNERFNMLTIFLLLAILVLIIALTIALKLYVEALRDVTRWTDAATWFENAYRQLDLGMQEITDAYESDSLQYEETIEKLNEEKHNIYESHRLLKENLDEQVDLRQQALETIVELETQVEAIEERVDFLKSVVDTHEAQCLPMLKVVDEIAGEMEEMINAFPPDCEQ